MRLFVEAGPFLEALLEDLRQAQRRIWIETYIFHDDKAGKRIAEVLKSQAKRGLDVRLIYDSIGSLSSSSTLFLRLAEAGVQIHAYHSFGEAFWRFSFLRILNRRNHRKLVVLDNDVAYFGGMNIVDVSSSKVISDAEHMKMSHGWRDLHVRLQGSVQVQLAESFERSWKQVRKLEIPNRPREYRRGELEEPTVGESIQFFDSGPGRRNTKAARLFTKLIGRARRRLTFSMAYFLPVGRVLRALLRAARRGVRITVVVPAESDVPIVQYATQHLYARLLEANIEIYERQRQMLHSKMCVVDEEWSVIGSCNMDARSLWINLELLGVFRSQQLVQTLDELIAYELSQSRRVTPEEYNESSSWRRLRNFMAWGLRWWL